MNLITLKSLQSRIREATGADRELDAFIAAAFLGDEAYHMPAGYEGFRWVRRDPVDNAVFGPAPYTSDPDGLGACVALMRTVLPGACLDFSIFDGDVSIATTYLPPSYRMSLASEHPCATNAILLAIIAARIAEEEAKQKDAVE